MEKYAKRIVLIAALVIFFGGGILSIVMKDKDFSEEENRYLAKTPELSVTSVLDGDYQMSMDTYLSDQMAFRTEFMRLYSAEQSLIAKTDYNGVYMCNNDRLIEKYLEPKNTQAHAAKFKAYAEAHKDINCYLMLVPTAISVYKEALPAHAYSEGQREAYDYMYEHAGMINIPVWEKILENKDKTNLYYKTDHHWTTDAAYIAYEEYCKVLGLEAVSKDVFNEEIVTKDFYGTVYSKVLKGEPDEIKAYKQDMTGIRVSYPSGEGNLYNEDFLAKKDKYSYFLNGINPVIEIENENVKNDKTLLVVKDSYANCFVPFLINHFEKVVVLDTRYYRAGVSAAAIQYGATDCLFLFNLNTFDTESALNGIY